jgi:hypothetical protein
MGTKLSHMRAAEAFLEADSARRRALAAAEQATRYLGNPLNHNYVNDQWSLDVASDFERAARAMRECHDASREMNTILVTVRDLLGQDEFSAFYDEMVEHVEWRKR